MRHESIDFCVLKQQAKPHLLSILQSVAPRGKRIGSEYVSICERRADRSLGSFKYNMNTNVWSDFANSLSSGNDIISYCAYALGISQIESARHIQNLIGGTTAFNGYMPLPVAMKPTTPVEDDGLDVDDEGQIWRIISPIPDTAKLSAIDVPLHKREIVSEYRNYRGQLLFVIIRQSWNKGMPYTYWVNEITGVESWRCKHIKAQRPLLNLQKILSSNNTVIIGEGEKSCNYIKLLFPELTVSTWSGGSNSVNKTCYKSLKGRHVILWPDWDYCGREAMRYVSNAAMSAGALSVKFIPIKALTQSYVIKNGKVASRVGDYFLAQGFDAADLVNTEKWTAELMREVFDIETLWEGDM